jgi:hypothetical protein
MTVFGTLIGGWTLGQAFNKLKEQGVSIAKNSCNIRSACKELGIPLPVEDNYKVLYIESLLNNTSLSFRQLWCRY